eukprot:TRINITY_DN91896_c0_g1_i1.p1 TRINITY_DN91896_c0_g1~~TRINITY_DN91896_c0_g1_i1.p1  ORF type:complete len:108 (-),score=10.97 TRINITY_DN91896_c0_g1_i1:14-337(-)
MVVQCVIQFFQHSCVLVNVPSNADDMIEDLETAPILSRGKDGGNLVQTLSGKSKLRGGSATSRRFITRVLSVGTFDVAHLHTSNRCAHPSRPLRFAILATFPGCTTI